MDPVVRHTGSGDMETFGEAVDILFGEWWRAIQTTYYISIGGFETEEVNLYSIWSWPIFFFCTIFNIIILLNLLIAIVNEIFNRVMVQKVQNRYSLMCKQISLCQRSFSWPNPGDYNRMLFIARYERLQPKGYDQNKSIMTIQSKIEKLE